MAWRQPGDKPLCHSLTQPTQSLTQPPHHWVFHLKQGLDCNNILMQINTWTRILDFAMTAQSCHDIGSIVYRSLFGNVDLNGMIFVSILFKWEIISHNKSLKFCLYSNPVPANLRLTHWPLGDVELIFKVWFFKLILWIHNFTTFHEIWSQVNTTKPHWWQVITKFSFYRRHFHNLAECKDMIYLPFLL